MKEFFKSSKFKILILIFFLLLGFIAAAARYNVLGDITTELVDTITSPIKEFSSNVSSNITGFFKKFASTNIYYDEMIRLQEENRKLREDLIEFSETKQRIEYLENLIGIIDPEDDSRKYTNATVIGRDPTDKYHSFTINKGEIDGISIHDPVITPDGLVGFVSSVQKSSARVQTILDPKTQVGALTVEKMDAGFISGDLHLALGGKVLMDNILLEADISIGNLIVTSSGDESNFPPNIPIGIIESFEKKSTGESLLAVVRPEVDIASIKKVSVIIEYREKNNDVSWEKDGDLQFFNDDITASSGDSNE